MRGIDELDDDGVQAALEALVERSHIRAVGFGAVPTAFVVFLIVTTVADLGPSSGVKAVAMLLVGLMPASLGVVPLLGRRHLRKALAERGIDPAAAPALSKRLRGVRMVRRAGSEQALSADDRAKLRGLLEGTPRERH